MPAILSFLLATTAAATAAAPSADAPCLRGDTDVCALVAKHARGLSDYLTETEIANSEFQTRVVAVKQEHTTLHIVQRWVSSSADFQNFLDATAFKTKQRFDDELVKFDVTMACIAPLREIVDAGGTVKATLLFDDGGTAHEWETTSCPPEAPANP